MFDVLALLLRERQRVVPKEELLDAVWGSRFVGESALTSRVKAARRAIGDDGRGQRLIRTAHGRGYQFVGEGVGRYPFVHVRDAVSVTARAVDKGTPGIYNVADDEPVPQAVWLPYLAELLDAPAPRHVSEEEAAERFGIQTVYYGNQLRAASNAKAKRELGLRLEYPSWREGFRQLFG